MGDVDIPAWLEGLPLAPEFHPTDTEFADPIAYISKIEKEASAFGICKVIPPLPKPSKKFVFSNLNKSLSRSPELSPNANASAISPSAEMGSGYKGNDGDVRAVFTTRHQELGQSIKRTKGLPPVRQASVHKQVWQSGEDYTLEQFESKSKAFARTHLGMIKDVSPLVIEALFWKASSEKPIYVEYANDVPGSGFGEPEEPFWYFHRQRRNRKFYNKRRGSSTAKDQERDIVNSSHKDIEKDSPMKTDSDPSLGSLNPSSSLSTPLLDEGSKLSKQKIPNTCSDREGTAGWKLSNSPWNLQVIARSRGSLTRFMPDEVPGVTSPMVYIGMLFSWFAWHVEDHELHSMNFLHTGSQKTWYAVPGEYAFAFEEVVRGQGYGGNIDRLAALTLLGEKTTLLSPEVVVASGIPCCRLVQNPGEFVVTFPRAYHVGFSHGFNCGEAANFGTPQWLKVAKDAAVRRAAMNYLPMLSHQQLLYLLTMSFVPRVPRAFLPGARSSRLRDRQKEERELLVKKAFIDDMLYGNTILSALLGKNSAYYAVLWDPESLPAPRKDPQSFSFSTSPDAPNLVVDERSTEICQSDKGTSFLENVLHNGAANVATISNGKTSSVDGKNENICNNPVDETRLCMETAELYVDDDDLPCGLHVDSGTLACVACGILGFPFMSVVQPSERALKELFAADGQLVPEGLGILSSRKLHASSNQDDSGKGSSGATDVESDIDQNQKGRLSLNCEKHIRETEGPKSGSGIQLIKNGTDAITSLSDATENGELKGTNSNHHLSGTFSSAKLNQSMLGQTQDLHIGLSTSQAPEGRQIPSTVKADIRADKCWNTSNGFLRPRVFCLQHTLEVAQMLHSKGGANVLIICHSDYLKIKAHTVTIAEEIGTPFNCKDIPLERASIEELNLINISIDEEEQEECVEDWTSKLGLNLHYFVKLKKMSPLSREQHALTLDGLFSEMNPGRDISSVKWQFRRSRTHRKAATGLSKSKLSENSQMKNNDMIMGQSGGCKVISENKILQYSRRKYHADLSGTVEASRPRGHPKRNMPRDVSETNDGNLDVDGKKASEDTYCPAEKGGKSVVDSAVFSTVENSNTLQEIQQNEEANKVREFCDPVPAAGLTAGISIFGISEAQIDKHNAEDTNMDGEACNLVTQHGSEMQYDMSADETSKMSKSSDCSNEISRVSDHIEFPGSSTVSIPSERIFKAKTDEASTIDKSSNYMTPDKSEMRQDIQTANGTGSDLKVCVHANSIGEFSLPISMLEDSEVPEEIQATDEPKGSVEIHSSQSNIEEDIQPSISESRPNRKEENKRKREVQIIEDQYICNGFIKSPCEGLRPRTRRVAVSGSGPNIKGMLDEKAVTKVRRQQVGSAACKENKDKVQGAHRCDIEGCRMSFKTRADLLMHKRNRCPHDGCGKRFSSHKYAMLHQRVHAEERPLKCPWKGCNMSFKWAWARTEHLRVHTGERPYECKVVGCGLTFRFVSDFSRHRRKTGHYVS
ncbi:lysine-specific demethylase SE14 isoform X1 [Telopea speciosissima]|uniref:lysine-specific demethylase SE14 isoform X1 n=1 Tax=Telopea speciosissima TaxID=54955 RepID=UPI001CC35FDC|nr:lysine-specific demethylase SE14 isoform X1 [Telopea speciosissima]